MESFSDKTVIVTGAASGIGRALSLLLAERGAHLVLVDIDARKLGTLRDEVGSSADVATLAGDVANPSTVGEVFEVAARRFGHVSGLASNAGVMGGVGPMTEVTVEEYERLMRVNAESAFLFVQRYARLAAASQKGGSVVITSSAAGIKGSSGLVAYSMSKQALVGLTRSAAVELSTFGVRVNAVTPGRIDTPLLERFVTDKQSGLSGRPIARAADPREVASLIAWLLSDEASFATGGIYPIDGGLTA